MLRDDTAFRSLRSRLGLSLVALTLGFTGCDKNQEIAVHTAELQKAFPIMSNESIGPGQASSAVTPYVNAAVAAVQTNGYAAAVILLDRAVKAGDTNSRHMVTVQEAKLAIVRHLIKDAARGKSEAKAALATIEKAQVQ